MTRFRLLITSLVIALVAALGWSGLAASAPARAGTTSLCTARISTSCSMYYARGIRAIPAVGQSGINVSNLQHSLYQLGYPVRVTGTYDSQTVTWVKVYKYERYLATMTNGRLYSTEVNSLRAGTAAKRTHPAMTTVRQGISAMNYAYSKIGLPYRYGATGPSAFDCSGLTMAAWRAGGRTIPRTTYAQYGALSKVSRSGLRFGDVVLFNGGTHAGLYAGDGYVVHAPRTGQNVKKVLMSSMTFYGAVRPA